MARERQMPMRRRRASEREQLDLFRALPGDLAPRDAQDLMAYPFFPLAKSKRTIPIDFRAGEISIRVEAVPDHGMATIWDADVLIWAASQIVEARDGGLKTSRLMAATPYEILTFVGRGTSARDYDRLKAAFDRLQSTTVLTSLRQLTERRRHRFSWINEWKETADMHGQPHHPFFTAEGSRQSFAPSVIVAALLDRNTSGKTTHTPQLKALRLDNPSLQKPSRHE
jgi:plasmid replication initiation protein